MQAPLLDIGLTTYFLASLLLMTIGAFLLTSLEPRDVERETLWSLRHRALWGLLTSVPLLLLMTALGRMGPNRGVLFATGVIVRLLLAITLTVAIHALLSLLAEFARRAPTPKLAASTQRSARFMAWALPVLFLAMFAHSRPVATKTASWLDMLFIVYLGTAWLCRSHCHGRNGRGNDQALRTDASPCATAESIQRASRSTRLSPIPRSQ